MGQNIDPGNPLYQPGGRPGEVLGAHGQPVEALGASTVPHKAPVAPPVFEPAPDATLTGGADLDLELDAPRTAAAGASEPPAASPLPVAAATPLAGDAALDFDLPLAAPEAVADTRPAAPSPATLPQELEGLDFDLGDLSSLGATPAKAGTSPAKASDEALEFGDFALDEPPHAPTPASMDSDALARKLELAEEFRQIGDVEGARDLLEEVVAKADGALRSKAQGMLRSLG
jgi:pilus assembly protein FimV